MTSNLLTLTELESRLLTIGESPRNNGTLDMIVCRPANGERRVLARAVLDQTEGLIGDNWHTRGSRHTADGQAHPDMQLTIMNSRIIQLLTQDRARWSLAGDQLYIDLDLYVDNLPPGQRLAIGTAILEITAIPHTGCAKFTERYGHAATRFVNSAEGRQHRRRGVNAKVIQSGSICVGDRVLTVAGSDSR
ncbi:MAG: MOSC domain-containing protein [Anaerolineae bacterium]|nr:MOSC domain-containing protein [Anaerolineae bacterium]